MNTTSTTEWTEVTSTTKQGPWGEQVEYQYAETTDPRFLAIIMRDTGNSVGQAFDGDRLNPIYYREWLHNHDLRHVGGYEDSDAADAWIEAYRRAPGGLVETRYGMQWQHVIEPDEFADRFLRVFHGAYVAHVDGSHGHDNSGEYLVFSTPDYGEYTGSEASQEQADSIAEEVVKVLEGDVWAIGWAVNEKRRLDDAPIDLNDGTWDIDIECWGFIGTDHAQHEALVQPYPDQPEMLDFDEPGFIEHTDRRANLAAERSN